MRTVALLSVLLFGCSSASSSEPSEVRSSSSALSAASSAELDFNVGWTQAQRGAVVRGGHVDVVYAHDRMTNCASPTIESFARFAPGGQVFSSDEALGFDVPADATSVALWFHAIAPNCEQWDSNYGNNWAFPVVATAPAAVGWAGDWGSSTNRNCTHDAGVPEPIVIDEYARERACLFVDADVWVPGVTDIASPHPEYVFAQVVWQKDTGAAVTADLQYQGTIGHNARFRWSLPYEVRNFADWSTVSYSFRFSTDGATWTTIAQDSGAARTITRAFTL